MNEPTPEEIVAHLKQRDQEMRDRMQADWDAYVRYVLLEWTPADMIPTECPYFVTGGTGGVSA